MVSFKKECECVGESMKQKLYHHKEIQEARVALACALSNSYVPFVLSKPPACCISQNTQADA